MKSRVQSAGRVTGPWGTSMRWVLPGGGNPMDISAKRQELHLSQREATEKKILAAAVDVFASKGYAAATVGEIVERSGLSRGAFYLYFENKNDIFKALVQQAVSDCYDIAPASRDLPLKERIRNSTKAHLEQFARHRGVLRCLFEVSTIEPELGALHNRYRAEFIRRIERHLERALEAGLCRPLDPKLVSYCLGCMIGGVAYMWLCADFDPWEDAPIRMDPVVDQITEFWYRTIYVEA